MARLGKQAALDVTEQALEVLRAVVVQVHLEPAHLGNVLFLAPGGVLADGIDAEIDVVALGVQVAQPGLGSAAGCRGRRKRCSTRAFGSDRGIARMATRSPRSNMLLR